jgi:thioredoxin reductase
MSKVDVAIIGAGPNGLSIAAHLAARGVSFRIFGKLMDSWQQMPKGMHLKSEGNASNLYDPQSDLTLAKYSAVAGWEYADLGVPVPLANFIEYGQVFQRKFVPELNQGMVTNLKSGGKYFALTLSSGEVVQALRVVVAVGITHFASMPAVFSSLDSPLVSHSSNGHADVSRYKGKDVIVLGAGSSAIDLAVLLHEAGAQVRLVTRRKALPIHTKMRLPRPLADKILDPMTDIGPSWRSWFFCNAAPVFHRLPIKRRLKWAKNYLGPAGCWFMNERIKPVSVMYGLTPMSAGVVGDKVQVAFVNQDGEYTKTETEHLISATGFQPTINRLKFLAPELQMMIQTFDSTPILSPHFESSVAGLYFVGPIAVNSFGPVVRFACGAKFTAPRIASHLARRQQESSRQKLSKGRSQSTGAGVGGLPAR